MQNKRDLTTFLNQGYRLTNQTTLYNIQPAEDYTAPVIMGIALIVVGCALACMRFYNRFDVAAPATGAFYITVTTINAAQEYTEVAINIGDMDAIINGINHNHYNHGVVVTYETAL